MEKQESDNVSTNPDSQTEESGSEYSYEGEQSYSGEDMEILFEDEDLYLDEECQAFIEFFYESTEDVSGQCLEAMFGFCQYYCLNA